MVSFNSLSFSISKNVLQTKWDEAQYKNQIMIKERMNVNKTTPVFNGS